MKFFVRIGLIASALVALSFHAPAYAHDVDGPDCNITKQDFGDAPEGVLAYPAVIGKFPTCILGALPSTYDVPCPPISTPPGPSGYVRHILTGPNYWLGCYGIPAVGFSGIDTEPDGKTNQPAVGFSVCNQGPTDCVEAAFGLTFDQDECYLDGSDAGVKEPTLLACEPSTVTFETANCTPQFFQAFLNILIDMNQDGDWNDNMQCATGVCAYEWAVKNVPIPVPPGCASHVSPSFLVGPQPGPGWMRVTISEEPVPDDFPWNGSISTPASALHNGETEDYPVHIDIRTPALPKSWGNLKSMYRI